MEKLEERIEKSPGVPVRDFLRNNRGFVISSAFLLAANTADIIATYYGFQHGLEETRAFRQQMMDSAGYFLDSCLKEAAGIGIIGLGALANYTGAIAYPRLRGFGNLIICSAAFYLGYCGAINNINLMAGS